MITNNGPHPADKWAEVSTNAILGLVLIADDATSDAASRARLAKMELMPKLYLALTEQHAAVQASERGKLSGTKGYAKSEIDPVPHVDGALAAVNAIMAASMFADHFATPDVQDTISNILAQHFGDSMNIERGYHADSKGT
jgi:hypothetical protein